MNPEYNHSRCIPRYVGSARLFLGHGNHHTSSSSVHQFNSVPATASTADRKSPWSFHLFDCFADLPTCCLTCWCPCITFGKIVNDEDPKACIKYVIFCGCFYSCSYRSTMRNMYGLEGNRFFDCLVHSFCECCALCQEYRQQKFSEEHNELGTSTVAPTVGGGMKR